MTEDMNRAKSQLTPEENGLDFPLPEWLAQKSLQKKIDHDEYNGSFEDFLLELRRN